MIRRILAAAAALVMIGACGGSAGEADREVLVDFSPDNFSTFVALNFPKKVEIAAGQAVVFKQTWTGEPHTITGGSEINDEIAAGTDWIDFFNNYEQLLPDNPDLPDPEDPGDATVADMGEALEGARPAKQAELVRDAYIALAKANPALPSIDSTVSFDEFLPIIDRESSAAFEGLPFASDDEGDINQNIGQSCYLESGEPPADEETSCTDAEQIQPVFDGTHSFYNSGILPYEGPRGNTFRVEFAKDTKPGTYFFYCAIHGLGQLSEIQVREPGTDVPSPEQIARRARAEALDAIESLEETFRDAAKDNEIEFDGEAVEGPFAGLPTQIHGMINEFVPRTIRAKVDEPITWKVMGGDHTISFDVPAYLPIVEFGEDRIRFNPRVRNPAGGAPEQPDFDAQTDNAPDDEAPAQDAPAPDTPPQEAPAQDATPPDAPAPDTPGDGATDDDGATDGEETRKPRSLDGGTWNGKGFWSSGVIGAEPYLEYTVRISEAGSYPYACLIHPKMIGKILVS